MQNFADSDGRMKSWYTKNSTKQ